MWDSCGFGLIYWRNPLWKTLFLVQGSIINVPSYLFNFEALQCGVYWSYPYGISEFCYFLFPNNCKLALVLARFWVNINNIFRVSHILTTYFYFWQLITSSSQTYEVSTNYSAIPYLSGGKKNKFLVINS